MEAMPGLPISFPVIVLLVSFFISIVGIGFVVPFLPIYATELGATGFALGFIMAAFSLSSGITQPLAGYFSDRLGRKFFLAAGLAVYSVGGFLYVLGSSVTDIVLVRFLQGVGGGFVFSVSLAYMADLAPKGYEGRYMGLYNVTLFSGFGLGPLLGGALKDTFGINMAFYGMCASSAMACILILLFLPDNRPQYTQSDDQRFFTVFRAIISEKRTCGVMLIRLGVMLSMIPSFIFLPVLLAQSMGASGVQIGLVITVRTVVSAIFQYPFGWVADHYSRVAITIVSVIGMASVVSLMGIASQYWHMLLLSGLLGINEALFMPANTAMMMDGGRSHGMGATMGLLNTSMQLGVFIGSLGAGMLVDSIGFRGAFISVGVIVTLMMGVSLPMLNAPLQNANARLNNPRIQEGR